MPEIHEIRESLACRAPVREVWKLLYDPVRFASWWPGWEQVETEDGRAVTRYDARWPEFAYPTSVTTDQATGRVVISCLLSDIVHNWYLEPAGGGCRVGVLVTIPEAESGRIGEVEATLHEALAALVARAEAGSESAGGR